MEFENVTVAELEAKVLELEHKITKYEQGIRRHRDSYLRGDDKCWKDNEILYLLLPEGFKVPQRDQSCELKNCEKYIASCHHPEIQYHSPQDRIDLLEILLFNATYYMRPLPQNELLRERIQQELKGVRHYLSLDDVLRRTGHSSDLPHSNITASDGSRQNPK